MFSNSVNVPAPGDVPGPGNEIVTTNAFNPSGGVRRMVADTGMFGNEPAAQPGTENMAESDKAKVHYMLAARASEDNLEQYVPETALRFSVSDPNYPSSMYKGFVRSFTLGALNTFLVHEANAEAKMWRDLMSNDVRRAAAAVRSRRTFITTPEEFARRVNYLGRQIPNQEFSDTNWSIALNKQHVTVPMKLCGNAICPMLWGNVREGEKLGFLVRARPDPNNVGTREAFTQRAPLEVVPVRLDDNKQLTSVHRLGWPLVSAEPEPGSRKRLRFGLGNVVSEEEFVRANRMSSNPREQYARIRARFRTRNQAASANDAHFLDSVTSSGTVYGSDICDQRRPPPVSPNDATTMYMDTEYKDKVQVDDSGATRHMFATTLREAHIIFVGTVRYASSQAYPSRKMIEKATFNDPTNVHYQALLSNANLDVMYGH